MKHIIAVVGRSGSGKSTLEQNLYERFAPFYRKAVSCTTRDMRPGEKEGIDYYFYDRKSFAELSLIEDTEFAGNKYGLSWGEYIKDHKPLLLVIEPHGLDQLRKFVSEPAHNSKLIIVKFDIPFDECLSNMINKRGDDPVKAHDRMKKDNIEELYKKYKFQTDIRITELTGDLVPRVHESIKSIINC